MKYAIIDIGSNSVRLMLWADGKTLYKKLCTTRMGAGLSESGLIGEKAAADTVAAVSAFAEEGRENGALVYAFATAAVRSAKNGAALCKRIQAACGIEVDVVSGEREAELALAGALGKGDGGIIDVGGASTEVVFRKDGQKTFSVSMNVGAVRLYDLCRDERAALDRTIDEALLNLDGARVVKPIFAVGGTASTLAALAYGAEEYGAFLSGQALSLSFVRETALALLSESAEERRKRKGMEAKRADIIAGGAYLLYKIMEKLGLDGVTFSDADNLEGYLHGILAGKR